MSSKTRRVTAQQVADRAGVSISAVSRAFTPGASVSKATLDKVMRAAGALGYQPNVMARSLMTGRTELIGLVSNNFDNPAFMEIFDLFTRTLQQHGLRPLLANLSGSSDSGEAIAMLRQYSVDAVIIASSTVSPAFVSGCLAASIPLVHAFGKSSPNGAKHVVGADNVQGGRLAAEKLLSIGYKRIGFLGGPKSASSTLDRLSGFRDGLKARGFEPALELFADRYAHSDGQELMSHLLRSARTDAVFCGDDILAIGALDACRDLGLRVPDDIGILGFNDIAMASWTSYNLSTIRQPIADIIITAVKQAIRLVEDPQIKSEKMLFTCEAVLRGTLRRG